MIFPPRTRLRAPERKNLAVLVVAKPLQFPGNAVPFFIVDAKDVEAAELALGDTREILVVPPKPGKTGELQSIGTYAKLIQLVRMPDDYVRVLIEARQRARILRINDRNRLLRAEVELVDPNVELTTGLTAMMQTAFQLLTEAKDVQKKIPQEKWDAITRAQTPDALVDAVTPYLNLDYEKKLELYLLTDPKERLEEFLVCLRLEMELNQINQEINRKVRTRLDRSQKEQYLLEKIKEMQRELGDDDDPSGAKALRERIEQLNMRPEIKERCLKEADRLKRLAPSSAENAILRTYLEWVTELPWNHFTEDRLDLDEAQRILDADHYDMKKVKDRILDFLAVRILTERLQRGPILCLLGPPGTGKTSLARSIARALNRQFVRVSLGGVRDEAEIRGHRRTYVGALPGRIIQGMKRAKASNPVMLLDEIDKISSDYKGDPAAALLEVLDPEINGEFSDHYLEIPYDLSNVFFITTANTLHTVSRPMADRLEVIEVPGYTRMEKFRIAKDYLIPKIRRELGLEDWNVIFEPDAIRELIDRYTSESGVRSLERNILQVLRRTTRDWVASFYDPVNRGERVPRVLTVDLPTVKQALGVPAVDPFSRLPVNLPGVAIGLAWTEHGGRVLPVEVSLYPGKGELVLTGSLGDVMKESAKIALSYIKSHYEKFRVDPESWQGKDIHIHFPEGAIPKDGPSAGLAMVCALVSAFRGQPLRPSLAMTGEVTLIGKVLPIGGLKEKLLAAHRQKICHVLLPRDNQPYLEDIPEEVTSSLTIHWVEDIEQAIESAFKEEVDEQPVVGTLATETA